jgi:hypothetical protein
MSKVRFLLVGAGAALALGTGGVLASVGAATPTNSDSHGDAVAAAAQNTCPKGPNGVHGECVSAIASSKSESKSESEAPDTTCTANANDTTEDASETKAAAAEDTSEKSANTTKAADKKEGKSEKAAAKAEDKSERDACKAPETPEAPEAPEAAD